MPCPPGRKPKQCSKCHRHARNANGWRVYRKDGVLTCTICDPIPKPPKAPKPAKKPKPPKPYENHIPKYRKVDFGAVRQQARELYRKREKQKLADLYRENPTESEFMLRMLLNGFEREWKSEFKCQAVLFGYIADFYCRERNLVIELDGRFHDNREDYDSNRDAVFAEHGIRTLRIASHRVFSDTTAVILEIRKAVGADRRKAA